MISDKLELIDEYNVKIIKNYFEKNETYHINESKKNVISYSNYLPKLNKIIYACFIDFNGNTDYNKEITNICTLTSNKIKYSKLFKDNNCSHNLSIFEIDNKYIGLGGVCSLSKTTENIKGIYFLDFDKNFKIINKKLLICKSDGKQQHYGTAYDSNISLVKYNNYYYVYTRYNKCIGERLTQIFKSDKVDVGYKYYSVISFNDKKIYTYTQNIYIENGIFIGFFRYYLLDDTNKTHKMYNNKVINILVAHSYDGINFIVDNYGVCKDNNIYDILVNNKETKDKYNYIFKNNLKNKVFIKYKIRVGGYINYVQKDSTKPSILKFRIINKEYLLINYVICNGGYIELKLSNKNETNLINLVGDKINYKIDLLNKYEYIMITFEQSKIYQIL